MSETINNSLHLAFTRNFENLEIAVSKLHFEISEEAIHDARVAIRSVNSMLIALRPILKQARVKKVRKQIRWLNKQFAQIRDLDVMTSQMRDHESSAYGSAIVNELINQRAFCEIRLAEELENSRVQSVLADLANFSKAIPLRRKFRKLKLDRQTEMIQSLIGDTWLDLFDSISKLPRNPKPVQLHKVRILAKRCRYTFEYANSLQLLDGQEQIVWAKQLQQFLGRVQDAATLATWIRAQREIPMELKVLALLQVQKRLPSRDKLIRRLAEPVTVNQDHGANSVSVSPQIIDRTMQQANATV
ncbi:MAG: CHAD domain-containing protein [Actinomycetales bacterium]|nr:CHAD domain-containing protein [Actinomycetales bacterium]